MEINGLSRTGPVAPVDLSAKSPLDPAMTREVVAAVRQLNKSELFGGKNELLFGRDSDTHRLIIRIVNRETGEMVDQIPPETVLHMLAGIGSENKQEVRGV